MSRTCGLTSLPFTSPVQPTTGRVYKAAPSATSPARDHLPLSYSDFQQLRDYGNSGQRGWTVCSPFCPVPGTGAWGFRSAPQGFHSYSSGPLSFSVCLDLSPCLSLVPCLLFSVFLSLILSVGLFSSSVRLWHCVCVGGAGIRISVSAHLGLLLSGSSLCVMSYLCVVCWSFFVCLVATCAPAPHLQASFSACVSRGGRSLCPLFGGAELQGCGSVFGRLTHCGLQAQHLEQLCTVLRGSCNLNHLE